MDNVNAAGAAQSPAELQRSVDLIETRIRELRDAQRAVRTQFLISTILTVGMMLLFGWMLYSAIRENLAQDKVRAAAEAKAQQIWPQAREQIARAAIEAWPTYQAEGTRRLQAIRPQLEQAFRKEAQRMPAAVRARLQANLEQSMRRVLTRLEPQLRKDFPGLTEEKAHELAQTITVQLTLSGGELADHIRRLSDGEVQRLGKALDQLPVSAYGRMEQDQLERQLMHKLVMLVDYHVLSGGGELGAGSAPLPLSPGLEGGATGDAGVETGPSSAARRPDVTGRGTGRPTTTAPSNR